MAEYIEREPLIKGVRLLPRLAPYNSVLYSSVQRAIFNAPTADVVEVVRCKDCKCYEEMKSENACFCNKFGGYVTEHDYCSRAEKKEGAEE